MTTQADSVRLGHAMGESDYVDGAVERALAIAMGEETLTARTPREATVVQGAEAILGHGVDLIYGYVGDLHPALGTVGLILSRAWADRAAIGASACDSGGLFGRIGGFAGIAEGESANALKSLSRARTDPNWDWDAEFSTEMTSHHADDPTGYVGGASPAFPAQDRRFPNGDPRRQCIEHCTANNLALDRRLWTWELQLRAGPTQPDVRAIVVSHEAFKRLEAARHGDDELPGAVAVLYGEIGTFGATHWFGTTRVRAVLLGGL